MARSISPNLPPATLAILLVASVLSTLLTLPAFSTPPLTTCSDLSGHWRLPADPAICHQSDVPDPAEGLQLPAYGGYMLPGLPAVVAIEQDGCRAITFRVVENEVPHQRFDFVGQEVTFDLTPTKRRAVTWTDSGLSVRHRVKKLGGAIFPGFSRAWAEWSLDLSEPDRIDYEYSFTEKGATFFIFPFENVSTSTCTLERLPQ